jgi:lipoate-protein ligase A
MVSHGTLLFNSDLSHVADALHVHENKFASKAVKSVRSRVANISEFLPRPIEIEDFKKLLLDTYFEGSTEIRNLPLTDLDWNNVHALADTRYRTWEWNYGKSPEFNIEKRQRFSGGEIIARLNVKGGVIQSIKFYGDYFSESTPEELESLFTNLRFTQEELIRASESIDINRFFNGMDQKTLIDFLLA